MYAIFEAGGNQHKAAVGDRVRVDLMPDEVGTDVSFDTVLLIGGKDVKVGAPTVDGAAVKAKVVAQGKDKKVIAYKYEQRNHARRKQGFRRHYTEVEVTSIEGA